VDQLHDFDMCIAKNEEAIRIEPQFAECYGNMANALKVPYFLRAAIFL
jgi:protein O-GlcNAc transferase